MPALEIQAAERRFQAWIDAEPQRAIAEYKRRFGNVIDRDNARELFPEYAASRESRQALGAATYRPAGELVQRIFEQEVAKPDPSGNNLAVFNAGGPGVGKSTGVQGRPVDAQLIVDGTLSDYAKSKANIQLALDHGKDVGISYTQRPYEEALRNIIERTADSGNGRVVNAEMAARGRIQARENVLRLAREYMDDPRVAVALNDNTGNRGQAMGLEQLRDQPAESLDDLRRRAQIFVNDYFDRHAASNPALTDALRRRILGAYGEGEDGPGANPGDREP